MPNGSLIADGSGNLYGVTYKGGSGGVGVVFKLAPNGAETILYAFPSGGSEGAIPNGPLLADNAGNLYGTAGGGDFALYFFGMCIFFQRAFRSDRFSFPMGDANVFH
jgi:uncharacterized repeat protein (TIGR03803 family)